MSPASPLRTLFAGALDYAGLFPPAQLPMPAAVSNYRRYWNSPERWALGRFVAPVARLEELGEALPAKAAGETWSIATIGTADPHADAAAIAAFNRAHSDCALVDCIEAVTPTPPAVAARIAASAGMTCFCESDPAGPGFVAAAAAVKAAAARAKLRTGGIVAAAIPAPAAVAEFLLRCHDLALPFKATAGLHHPIRGVHNLTYAPDSATAVMHGFLNLALAAASAAAGAAEAEVIAILECADPATLAVEPDAILWRGWSWSQQQLAASRRFFLGFGSCDFEEPLQWLSSL